MKESDKELLELAAKAADIKGEWCAFFGITGYGAGKKQFGIGDPAVFTWGVDRLWNPLEDDGDALRLAVRLKLIVSFADAGGGEHVCSGQRLGPFSTEPLLILHSDLAATRRAIVRAAAEIGKAMP